jgi:toxin ParE1/3/4
VKRRPVVLRERASRDIDDAIERYVEEGALEAANRFVDALEKALERIGRSPGLGSTRYALNLNLPGLRHWSLGRYPYLVFYVEQGKCIEVWRVLHERRDIPAQMQEAASPS